MSETRYTTDTSAEAELIQLELLRKMTPGQRLAKAVELSCHTIQLCKTAIRRHHPEISDDELRIKFIEINYGARLAESVRAWRNNIDANQLESTD